MKNVSYEKGKNRRNAAEEEKLGTTLPFTAAAILCDNRRILRTLRLIITSFTWFKVLWAGIITVEKTAQK